MKQNLRKIFSPLLRKFEAGDQPFSYKPSHRIILLVMSAIFAGLGTAVFFVAPGDDLSYLLPVILFVGGGVLGILIGLLGNDRAVAKIWGSR
ncbi:MAG TPA: hypothetical protein ENK06_04465 [Gammaproteobacteria bacterium]|nr:hypothetical protein [Gammaproteobacteria bacterium]